MEGTVANIQKHPKRPIEEVEQADFSPVPTHARSPRLVGHYIKNREKDVRLRASRPRQDAQAVLLRLADVEPTPQNIERIRRRIRLMNQQLASSGKPFRLRMI